MLGHLNVDVSFCELGGRLFFLDIQRDRYFQLSATLERTFLRYLESPDDPNIDVSALVEHTLLTQLPTARPWQSYRPTISQPGQSVLEAPCSHRRIPARIIRDVFVAVCTMRWQLTTHPLKSVLQGLDAYRGSRTSLAVNTASTHRQRLLVAATDFNRVRPYVPIETCCLIDSLSMVRFLAKQGLYAHLIMGIAGDPFSAHAWVQHGPLVLNETVGTAQAHVPIRVI